MTVRYISQFHSAEDPGGLIGEALSQGADFPGPAEDLLLAWSLRLADDLPAPEAARLLLERHSVDSATLPGAAGRLVELLRQTAAADPQATGRRRGGWRGRRS